MPWVPQALSDRWMGTMRRTRPPTYTGQDKTLRMMEAILGYDGMLEWLVKAKPLVRWRRTGYLTVKCTRAKVWSADKNLGFTIGYTLHLRCRCGNKRCPLKREKANGWYWPPYRAMCDLTEITLR